MTTKKHSLNIHRKYASWLQKYSLLIMMSSLTVGTVTGYFYDLSFLKPFIPITVFLIVYPAMVTADLTKILHAFHNTALITAVLILCYIVDPLLGIGISHSILGFREDLTIGFILFSLMPAINALPGWIRMAQGDINTAIVVQVLTLLLTTVTLPLGMLILVSAYVPVPYEKILSTLFSVVILPLSLALLTRKGVRRYYGEIAEKNLVEILPPLSILGLAFTFFIVTQDIRNVLTNPMLTLKIFIASIMFYWFSFASGIILCKLLHQKYEFAIVNIMSAACRNVPMGLGVSSSLFPGASSVLIIIFIVQVSSNGIFVSLFPRLRPFFDKYSYGSKIETGP